ncbi:putative peptide zinc metalloprotease protein [Tistlia consotensis]|uniref:Putative peptide zinc metalloprotease protein n=1 Tax=Tistlia consotensis USBA 355 TaxID=560819 RepID=A0A1Y6CP86_9PROT|nr:site-2 protease family protein [Tistlia consotensis]SMF80510.1 putative peptide zinc metalloprotease protein [Tistlia consotensis USBA 355]SNR62843.1 putative peptide zinc metalloprotease protein [Tistlia consotensis]
MAGTLTVSGAALRGAGAGGLTLGQVTAPAGVGLAAGPGGERLTPLREDLSLHQGPRSADGAPTWTLHDPAANRFLRIGWLEFEILSRWALGDAAAIARSIARETPIPADIDDVERFKRFAEMAGLLRSADPLQTERLKAEVERRRQSPLGWLLKNYLFVRVPLIRPDRFLERTGPAMAFLFRPWFRWLVAVSALIGVFLVSRQWEAFLHAFPYLFTPLGALTAVLALSVSKTLHEFGHAYTSKRFGCRVATMGVAFLVMWPVLYTDTTDAWRLTSRRERLGIGFAGMAMELALAAFATLLWSFLPDGPLRTACFLTATVTWTVSVAINLNPFMRFDGYYLMSDLIDVPNLQERSFALARWQLREILFGFGLPPPEALPRFRRRLLIGYAVGTWIYRLTLFLGIAVLVYYYFFKALGIFLFMVEISVFIVRPILRELINWWSLRVALRWTLRSITTLALLGGAIALLLIPWQSDVSAPALLRAAATAGLYAPQPARIEEVALKRGDAVRAGDLVIRLGSPDLDYEIASAERKIGTLRLQLAATNVSLDLAQRNKVALQSLEEALTQHAGLLAEKKRLTLTAPLDGRLAELPDYVEPGAWIAADEEFGLIVSAGAGEVEAYVDESDLWRFRKGAPARFYPADGRAPLSGLTVAAIDDTATRALDAKILASEYGGGVPVRRDEEGKLVPQKAVYRVLLRAPHLPAPARAERGTLVIAGARESLIGRFWRHAVSVLVRESSW